MKIAFHKPTIKLDKAKKIPWFLASHAFLMILLFVLFYIILGIILFYQYIILVELQWPNVTQATARFQYGDYQKVLEAWQAKEKNSTQFPGKSYTDPFNP